MIDQPSNVRKGANAVVSMVDYYCQHHVLIETTVSLLQKYQVLVLKNGDEGWYKMILSVEMPS